MQGVRTHPERGELDIAVLLHVPLHATQKVDKNQHQPKLGDDAWIDDPLAQNRR
jgi:hypothetical protein